MRTVTRFVGLALLALAGSASAQEAAAPAGDPGMAPSGDAMAPVPGAEAMPAPAPAPTTGYPDEYAMRPLTLGAGMFQVTAPIVLNLSKDAVLKPVWIPLDLRYGVNDQLEVFVTHSPLGIWPAAGEGGVCLGGKDRNCEKFYNNISLGGQFSFLKNAGLELSALAALDFRRLSDPMQLAIDIGVGFKYVTGQIAIKATPMLSIGANKRSEGNKEHIAIPVQVAFQANPQLAAFLDTGIAGATEKFGDNYIVPLGIGASYLVMHGLDVGAEFMLTHLVSGLEGNKAADGRTLTLFASYRMP